MSLARLTTTAGSSPFLDSALLRRIAARAASYDKENRFFHEDLEELREAGFLKAGVPVSFGGFGLSGPELIEEIRRLAYYAPSTALALNMHLYWTGAAVHLWHQGDKSGQWILEEAASGKLFAAGHGEPGNDLGLAHAFVTAVAQPDGGYRFSGRKVLTSLSPAWDWLGVHGLDASDPTAPKIVHAFIRRDAAGVDIVRTWDALGLRATGSDDTVLTDAYAAPDHVIRVLPAGPPVDDLTDGILASAIPGISAVYNGIARRAFDLAVSAARQRTSAALGGQSYAHHAPTQTSVAEAAIELDALEAVLDRVVQQWWDGVDHGARWPAKFLAAKQQSVEGAKRVVDLALKIAGASSLARSGELERLYRDVRARAFHPPNGDAARDIIARTYLGLIGPSEPSSYAAE
jgi:alkylation response protein AidB-like acyl-CoA dehydrogenase